MALEEQNEMSLNAEKTKVMLITTQQKRLYRWKRPVSDI